MTTGVSLRLKNESTARIAQDIRAIESALRIYRLDNFRYPSQSQGLEALVYGAGDNQNWNGPYLEKLPNDPWDQPYRYANPSTHNKQVDVFTLGFDNTPGGEKELIRIGVTGILVIANPRARISNK